MKIAIFLGLAVFVIGLLIRKKTNWGLVHQRVVGFSILLYGLYLATLTGTATKLVLPGIGAIGVGAFSGGGVGFLTWLVVGTVGVATGGVGLAIGGVAMTMIGAAFGVVGSGASGIGLQKVSYPLVSPIFWVPVIVLSIYFLVGRKKKKALEKAALALQFESKPESDRLSPPSS